MRIEASGRRKRGLVSLTPLIDVVFILLFFFMLATSYKHWRAVELRLAVAAPVPAAARSVALEVRVLPDGSLLSDGERVTLPELRTRVVQQLQIQPGRVLLLDASPEVELQRIVSLMDVLHAAGATHIAFLKH